MYTLRSAFFEGIASPILWKKWCRRDWGLYGVMSRYPLHWLLTILAITLIWLGAGFVEESLGGGPAWIQFYTLAVILGFLCVTLIWKYPMREFLRDCRKLHEQVPYPGLIGFVDLSQRAHARLVALAEMVVLAQRNGEDANWGESRKRFNEVFFMMSRFELTKTTWVPYFESAQARIKFVDTPPELSIAPTN